jgi:ferric hydroxamate transport system substrate-binding protein
MLLRLGPVGDRDGAVSMVERVAVCARRRALLRAAGACGLVSCGLVSCTAVRAGKRAPARVIVLNWDLAEMLLSLGMAPVGLAAPAWYTKTVVEPPLPSGIVDVGLLYQPNYDVLFELSPDLLLVTPGHASARASFERLAPTLTLGAYATDPHPYGAMRIEARTLAKRLGRDAQADALIAQTDDAIAQARDALAAQRGEAVCIAQAVDDRHLRVFGPGSLFDDLLRAIGLENAASRDAGVTNASAIIDMERAARMHDARVLWTGSGNTPATGRNPVWRALPFSRTGRSARLPVISPTGALVSSQRFVRAVSRLLPSIETHRAF